jgi:hypothetical protein
MRILLVSALALGAFTSAAMAEPISLTDAQMDSFTAGQVAIGDVTLSNSNSTEVNQSNTSEISADGDGDNSNTVTQTNSSTVENSQSNSFSFTVNEPPV